MLQGLFSRTAVQMLFLQQINCVQQNPENLIEAAYNGFW